MKILMNSKQSIGYLGYLFWVMVENNNYILELKYLLVVAGTYLHKLTEI